VPGSSSTGAEKITNKGEVSGFWVDNAGTVHGFVYLNREFITVDFPGSLDNRARGVNIYSRAVGRYTDANGLIHVSLQRQSPDRSVRA
jgi:hypothetical protein